MAKALKTVGLKGYFSPAEVGAKIGLSKMESENAARALSNDGILVIGFDCAAEFSPEYQRANAKPVEKVERKPAKRQLATAGGREVK